MIGRTFSHYRLVSELGAGGMGVVYKARDEKLPRYVAIKVLRPEYTQSQAVRWRFLGEARAAAAVQHPYIAQIHDADEEDGTLFIVMEYVEGSTLRDTIRGGSYSLRDALHHSCEIAEGLAHVHAAGVIHRDLKPGNIMLSTDGHAKILDFGLAKLVEERDVETKAMLTVSLDDLSRSTRAGTPAYMSPEQVRGGSVDQRSDVFAFGATLFEALTRQPLFGRCSQSETLAAILHEDSVHASALNPAIPPELDWILEKCLAKEPSGRYQDTRDLAIDLDHLRWKFESGAVLQHDTPGNETTRPLRADALQRTSRPTDPNAPALAAAQGPDADGRKTRHIPKRVILAFAAVAIAGLLPIVVPEISDRMAHTSGQILYARGLQYLREESETVRSLDTAIHMFNQSLAHDSTAVNTWAALGEAYWIRFSLSKEQPFADEAEAAVARAQALDPESAQALNAQGRGLLAQGRYEDARQTLQRAVQRDKGHAFAWVNLGRAHQGLRNYAEGLKAIQRAIELEPQSFRHRISLGMFYSASQEPEAALTAYRQAIDLKPNSNYAWNNLGGVLLKMGSYDQAINAFNESIKIVDNGFARSNLGTAYFFKGGYEAAEQEYRRAIALEPHELAHYENLIDALIKLGKPDQVQEMSRAALARARLLVERTPHDAKAHLRLATLCARTNDPTRAITEATQSLNLEPENVQILFRSAKVYGILHQEKQALDVLEKAVNLGLSKVEIVNDPDLEALRDSPRFQRILVLAS